MIQKKDVQKKADKVMNRHMLNNPSHKIDFDHFHILDSENNEQKRKISEMLLLKIMKMKR